MIAKSDVLTIERLRQLLSYDPDNGFFIWRLARGGQSKGAVAGSLNAHRHVQIYIDRRNYYAHRLAWLYMTGRWPKEIDHCNGIRDDNRFCNLRECERFQNAANTLGHSRTGLPKGVRRNGRNFSAYIYRGKLRYLGTFPTTEQASLAYKNAAQQFDGEFFFELRERITDGYREDAA